MTDRPHASIADRCRHHRAADAAGKNKTVVSGNPRAPSMPLITGSWGDEA